MKYSYNANITNIEEEYSVLHSEAGLVSTMFFITYGAGQIINGIFVKKYNLKYFMPAAVIISCLLNVLVMVTPIEMFYMVKYYWLINGMVLSTLWPCTIRMLTENIADKYKNKAVVIIGLVSAVGTGLTYALSSLFTALHHYKLIYVTGVILGVLFSLLWLMLYKAISLPIDLKTKADEETVNGKKANFSFLLYVFIVGLFSVIASFSRDGIQSWCPSILCELFNFDNSISVLITVVLPIASFVGAMIAVALKKIINSNTILLMLLSLLAILSLTVSWIFNFAERYSLIVSMVVTILSASCSTVLTTSVIPMSWSKTRNSGLFAGVFDGCCYLGSAIAAYGMGLIADIGGWPFVFQTIIYAFVGVIVISGCFFVVFKILKNSIVEDTASLE